ncbi:MAG TPA: thermonuclease family protein [Stellaceae bacterium]|nr:thermonuclease family protein [Stellaceae bacterium]
MASLLMAWAAVGCCAAVAQGSAAGLKIVAAEQTDLPTVDVQPHVIHAVPETVEPTPPPAMPPALFSPLPPRRQMATTLPNSLNGPARPLNGVSLSVLGRRLRLFGIRTAEARDFCPLRSGPAQPCAEVARDELTARLIVRPAVSCHSPPGQRGEPGFVCHDSTGIDLGAFLVSEGLALADTRESYEYFNAQDRARASHRGLWRYR